MRKQFGGMEGELQKQTEAKKCTKKSVLAYFFDNPESRAVVTTQFQLLDHPKVHTLPLTVKSWKDAQLEMKELSQPTF